MEVTAVGPRRYKVHFDCSDTDVASIIGLLVKDVESSKMDPAGPGLFKVSMICMFDQIPMITDLVVKNVSSADNLVVVKHEVVVAASVHRFAPSKQELNVTALGAQAFPVHRLPTKLKRVKGGAKPSDSNAGRLVMGLFKTKSVVHYPDVADALEGVGLSASGAGNILARLTQEGVLVRCGHGAYRRPTSAEEIQFIAQRQAQLGASPRSSE